MMLERLNLLKSEFLQGVSFFEVQDGPDGDQRQQ